MDIEIGKVIEVFIPNFSDEDDVMEVNNIGFKIGTQKGIIELICEQDQNNINILKDDLVVIRKQIISGKEFIDIDLLEGEHNE